MIAALFVQADGCYSGLPGVELWDEVRDARLYAGPWPVVCHPPCQRWGRFWHGSTRKPHQFKMGDDQGCFSSTVGDVRLWGGVLEHPADSHAWDDQFGFGMPRPVRGAGWTESDASGGRSCYVEQGHYGHVARKGSFLYAVLKGAPFPELDWSFGAQRIHPRALELHGYEKARRIGMMAMMGGKNKTKNRNATPPPFRDILLGMARSVNG